MFSHMGLAEKAAELEAHAVFTPPPSGLLGRGGYISACRGAACRGGRRDMR